MFCRFSFSPWRGGSPSKEHKQPLNALRDISLNIADPPCHGVVCRCLYKYQRIPHAEIRFECITVVYSNFSSRNARLFVFINMSVLGNQGMITRYHTERHTLARAQSTCPVMDPAMFEFIWNMFMHGACVFIASWPATAGCWKVKHVWKDVLFGFQKPGSR